MRCARLCNRPIGRAGPSPSLSPHPGPGTRRSTILGAVPLLLVVMYASAAGAQEIDRSERFEVRAGVGQQAADFRWNIGFGPDRSNILSELTYRDLRVPEAWAGARVRIQGDVRWRWVLDLSARRGRIGAGTGQDSDYRGAGRTGEFSRSRFDVAGSTTAAEAGAVGIQHLMADRGLDDVTLWIGHAREHRSIRKRDGVQLVPAHAPQDLLEGLDSRYRARWAGATVALEPAATVRGVRLEAVAEWNLRSRYRAEGEWNLRDDLAQPISFVQLGRGRGLNARLRGSVRAGAGGALVVEGALARQSASGVDRLIRASGEEVRQDLHESRWRAAAIRLGIAQRF